MCASRQDWCGGEESRLFAPASEKTKINPLNYLESAGGLPDFFVTRRCRAGRRARQSEIWRSVLGSPACGDWKPQRLKALSVGALRHDSVVPFPGSGARKAMRCNFLSC